MQSQPPHLCAETLTAASKFATEAIAPYAAGWEIDRNQPRATLEQAAQAGLTGLLVPQSLGGLALSKTSFAQVAESLAAADLGIAFALVVHNNLMNAIATSGSDYLCATYLPQLQSMQMLGAFLLTEPTGGSDAAALQTQATRTADGWRLRGAKSWVTNAQNADLLSVYAQTDPAAGAKGIACFVVPANSPGVHRLKPYTLLGAHSMGTGGFEFDNCEVPANAMLAAPGQGFKAALAGIDLARAVVAAMSCGILNTCLEAAVAHANQRQMFGQQLSDMQGMQWQLADVATDLHAMRLLSNHATGLLDRDEPATVAAAHAKKFATRRLLAGVAECMQALGAQGLTLETPLARHYAAAKITQYIDGTTEIQNVVLSRALFRNRH